MDYFQREVEEAEENWSWQSVHLKHVIIKHAFGEEMLKFAGET